MNKSNQHSLPQSLEVAIALWEQHLNEFAVLLSDAIPSLKNTDWIIEKSECLLWVRWFQEKKANRKRALLPFWCFAEPL